MSQVFGERPAAPRGSSGCGWVVWIFLIGGLLLVLAMTALVAFGWSLFSGQAQAALQADPVIAEHIGTISEMDVNLSATGEAEGANEFVWDLQGNRGTGRVVATLETEDDTEVLAGGTLTLADGRTFPIGRDADPDVEAGEATGDEAAGEGPAGASPGDSPNYKSNDVDKAPPPEREAAPDAGPPPVEVE